MQEGLSDLNGGVETEAALLVQIAAPRLRTLGVDAPSVPQPATGRSRPRTPTRATKNRPFAGGLEEAQQRTRTADPFLTMEVLYQLS